MIIPTRNRFGLLIDAVESVRQQTMKDWHLVIVDDGSNDGSLDHVREFVAGDHRIDLVARSDPGGPQAARQTGLTRSNASYIATLDSDDLWYPEKLDRQLACFASEGRALHRLGTVLCWHEWVEPDGQRRGGVRRPRAHGQPSPLVSTNMSTPLMRREALLRAGGFLPSGVPALFTCEGIEFYLRLTQQCDFAVVPEMLVTCRHHDGARASSRFTDGTKAEELVLVGELHRRWLSSDPDDLARVLADTGARYMDAGFRLDGLQHLASALRVAGPRAKLRLLHRYGPFALKSIFAARGRTTRDANDG